MEQIDRPTPDQFISNNSKQYAESLCSVLETLLADKVAIMGIQSQTTIVLANRPRLLRELIHHALNTAGQFRVVEVVEALPSASALGEAKWLIVDEASTPEVEKAVASHPHLNVLSLEGRGGRASLLAPSATTWKQLDKVPNLSQLYDLLAESVKECA